ncbi:MAG: hypothetical protein HS111_22200 [Kofleriaceae bacterium]|nr:hypothetical protein [Kofleriaceae bacterium]
MVDGDAVIDAGSIGFARFIRFDKPVARWRLAGDVHGHRAARRAPAAADRSSCR